MSAPTIDAPITDAPKVDPESIEKVEITNFVNGLKKKAKVPLASEGDPEVILSTLHEFDDLCSLQRLNLDTPPMKFEKLRECLRLVSSLFQPG